MIQKEDVTCVVQGKDGRNNFSNFGTGFSSQSLLQRRGSNRKKTTSLMSTAL
jgi:hypothetical protein